ncbi:hypothetical protein ACF09J_26435 [Streptomyces sp. NPDC014889]|uniref:hypothetical protein n=1 Tax=Streptomyces sp. NPDC014889 TaxID=3364928 RepID=UPI0036FE237B
MRISAQSMDVLSSPANVAGYQAVPATAKRLGARTTGFDVRPEVGVMGHARAIRVTDDVQQHRGTCPERTRPTVSSGPGQAPTYAARC